MVERPLGMAVPVEFLFPARPAGGAAFSAQVEQGNGSGPASTIVAVCLGGSDPAVLYARKRFAPGILQLWGMARDCHAAGAWHSACRGNRPSVAKARPTSPGRTGRGACRSRRLLSLDFHAHSRGG